MQGLKAQLELYYSPEVVTLAQVRSVPPLKRTAAMWSGGWTACMDSCRLAQAEPCPH